jgi:hypothetical protein
MIATCTKYKPRKPIIERLEYNGSVAIIVRIPGEQAVAEVFKGKAALGDVENIKKLICNCTKIVEARGQDALLPDRIAKRD